jgi:hypothetical protein
MVLQLNAAQGLLPEVVMRLSRPKTRANASYPTSPLPTGRVPRRAGV